jgi:hypothetical protein
MSKKKNESLIRHSEGIRIVEAWQSKNYSVKFKDKKSGATYQYPHDAFLKEVRKKNPEVFETPSWRNQLHYYWPSLTGRGRYSWFRDWLKPYCVQESVAHPGTEEAPPIAPRTDTRSVEPAPLKSESDDYLQAVRDWRNYWRPETINVLLIAESHVHEMDGDHQAKVVSLEKYGLQDHPEVFCRLIHCLGYGEQDLLTSEVTSNGGGTWQFWDIFGAIACGDIDHPDSKQPRKGESDLAERLRWKVNTLEVLRRRGIWLIDACPYAIYIPGGDRKNLPKAKKQEINRLFSEKVLTDIDTRNLRSSWIIGKGVDDIVAEDTPSYKGWVYQPQARVSDQKRREKMQPLIDDVCISTS